MGFRLHFTVIDLTDMKMVRSYSPWNCLKPEMTSICDAASTSSSGNVAAIRLEHLLATGQLKDQAEIARTAGITRARVGQIISLARFAPDIQEAILYFEPTTDPVPRFRERKVRTKSANNLRSCRTGESNR